MIELDVSQWTLFALSGALAGALALWSLRRAQLKLRTGLALMAAALFAGLWIGHWTALAFKPHLILSDPSRLLILTKGGVCSLGVYGGAALGMAAFAKLRKLPFWPYADAFAPGLLVAAAAARLGCLIHGCDFGHITHNAPWAVRYLRGTSAFAFQTRQGLVDPFRDVGLPMHPFPLYEALPVFLVGLSALCVPHIFGRSQGQRAAGCAALYCAVRLFAEHYRATSIELVPSLSVMQALCLIGLSLFAYMWWRFGCAAPQHEHIYPSPCTPTA